MPLLVAAIGYLIGSIPFAYLVVRRHASLDLRRHGTGNIGAANAYDVTGKRKVGATVMVLDMLKGFIPVLVCELLGWRPVLFILIPSLVLGHCYPIWLRFRGGRGLATTAGALLLIQPVAVLVWSICYLISNRFVRNTHIAATIAICVCLLLLLLVDDSLVRMTTLGISGLSTEPAWVVDTIFIVLLIILSRYIRPLLQSLQGKQVGVSKR